MQLELQCNHPKFNKYNISNIHTHTEFLKINGNSPLSISKAKYWCSLLLFLFYHKKLWWWGWFICSVMSNSYNPMDCSPLGSSVCGILQARILEWVVNSFSSGSSQLRKRTLVSCIAGGFFTDWAIIIW